MLDASGRTIAYVKQKLFKLKEDIRVYADETQSALKYTIAADRILDFSARYEFADENGKSLGSIKRQGMRSVWKAHYDIADDRGEVVMQVDEENVWIRVADAVVGELPLISMFTGYFLNPAYVVTGKDGKRIARLTKSPAFFESKFQLTTDSQLETDDEVRLFLGILTMTLMERNRG